LVAGAAIIAFQLILIVSGNLSFLNWLTIAIALACFDDRALARVLPQRLVLRAQTLEQERESNFARTVLMALVAVGAAILSMAPVANMLSPNQAMNTSFTSLHLVNSYGAFGSVGKVRREVILQGTRDANPANAHWLEYEFKCKPGDVMRRPCLITPYHYRLDWQMWFAALSDPRRESWMLRLVYELLRAEPAVRGLLARDPFGDLPPRFVRAELYEYHFAPASDPAWWTRKRIRGYLPPMSPNDVGFREFLRQRDWLDDEDGGH
jgi:hypothetical protein